MTQVTMPPFDPRKPVRPEGDAGSNWVQCRGCGRGAYKMSLIRHDKSCRAKEKKGTL
jgi:hypothetical protein